MATISSENRLRQIAILVASVDSASARHLLLNLPTEIARKVRSLAAEIGPIPPEERRQLMSELQKVQTRSSSVARGPDNLETASNGPTSQASIDSLASSKVWSEWPPENGAAFDKLEGVYPPIAQPQSGDTNAPAWTRLSVDALLRFVRHERPTVIAVIVSQLSAVQAAAILQRLPRSLSRDVLQCFGSLKEIDSEARQTIDEHLSQRLSEYKNKIETEVENVRRINELLAAAPPELKQQWASWLRPDVYASEEHSATPGPSRSTSPQTSHHNSQPLTAPSQLLNTEQIYDRLRTPANGSRPTSHTQAEFPSTIPFQPRGETTSGSVKSNVASTPKQAISTRTLRSVDLEVVLTLSPEQLASLLSNLDSQTVLLALAGASPQFMNRFSALLENSDAKVLNDRIQKIGPLQLRDVDEAQKRVIDAYWTMLGPMGLRLSA